MDEMDNFSKNDMEPEINTSTNSFVTENGANSIQYEAIASTSNYSAHQEDINYENNINTYNATFMPEMIETPSPEFVQKKLYFLLEQLKQMHQAIPE